MMVCRILFGGIHPSVEIVSKRMKTEDQRVFEINLDTANLSDTQLQPVEQGRKGRCENLG